jgi:hypothetical protein
MRREDEGESSNTILPSIRIRKLKKATSYRRTIGRSYRFIHSFVRYILFLLLLLFFFFFFFITTITHLGTCVDKKVIINIIFYYFSFLRNNITGTFTFVVDRIEWQRKFEQISTSSSSSGHVDSSSSSSSACTDSDSVHDGTTTIKVHNCC